MISKYRKIPQAGHQGGMALIMVLVVLLVLTILAVSSSETSNLQSLMSRNNQLRMEAFNASNVEIEAQIDRYLASTDTPAEILKVINAGKGSTADSYSNDIVIQASDSELNQFVELKHEGGCWSFGQQENIGSANRPVCTQLLLSSNVQLLSPNLDSSNQRIPLNIRSNQRQTLEFESLQ